MAWIGPRDGFVRAPDAPLPLVAYPNRSITRALALEALERAGPFGAAAPAPRFALPDQIVEQVQTMGDSHLRLRLRSPGAPPLDAVSWGAMQGQLGPALLGLKGRRFHLAGRLELSVWGGRQRIRLRLDDAAPAG